MKNEAFTVKLTNGVAVGGITMPAWWPTLAEISSLAATLVPIFSLIWLAIQIIRALRTKPPAPPVPPAPGPGPAPNA